MSLPTDPDWGFEVKELQPGEGEKIALSGGDFVNLLVTGRESSGGLCFFEFQSTPGHYGIPLHLHRSHEELWYILDGKLNMRIGDEEILAKPRSTHFVPRNVPHRFWCEADEPCFFLGIFTPAGFEGWFRERAQLIAEGKLSMERMMALSEKYDQEMLERPPSSMATSVD